MESDNEYVAVFVGDEKVGDASVVVHPGSATVEVVGGARVPGRPTPSRVVLTMDPHVAAKVMEAKLPVRLVSASGKFTIQPTSSSGGVVMAILT